MREQYLLVTSTHDPAGRTMADCLSNDFGFMQDNGNSHLLISSRFSNVRMLASSVDLLHREDLDGSYPEATAYIFLSKHKSDSKIPTLTCHCTGNFGDNPYGGNPRELAISFPSFQKAYLNALVCYKEKVPEYDIVIEATHHGPTSLKRPLLFVELGSSEKQWADKNAAHLICRVVLEVIQSGPGRCGKVAIGLGGTHYPSKFNNLLLESEYGLAAVASKHNLEFIDEEMLGQMFSKSVEKVTAIALDGKGLGTHKDRLLRMAEKSGLEVLNLK